MVSQVQIVNKALRRLGQSPIQNIDERSPGSDAVKAIYDQVRDEVLAGHPWNCALFRAALAAETTAPAFGFARQFRLPAGGDTPYCLRVWQVGQDPMRQPNFQVEGRLILADEAGPLYVRYISRVVDPEQLSPWVADQISNELAYEVSYGLTNSTTKEAAMREQADKRLKLNRTLDAQEGTTQQAYTDDFLSSRG